jgi:hypothetical protein
MHAVPPFLSSLLKRARLGVLALLVVVLPLQGMVQFVQGFHGHRHVHTGAVVRSSWLAELTQPVRAVLDRLHAAQDPRLQGPAFNWAVSQGDADGWHEHHGLRHKHAHGAADALDVGDAADDAVQGGVTAFLAWLPAALVLPAVRGTVRPGTASPGWRDRDIAPPQAPPRG